MTRDSLGFLWIGTGEGLSRFDGAVFRNYYSANNKQPGLAGNAIASIREFRYGHLALISGYRLSFLNTLTHTFYSPPAPFRDKKVFGFKPIPGKRFLVAAEDSIYITDADLAVLRTLPLPGPKDPYNMYSAEWLNEDLLFFSNSRQHYLIKTRDGATSPLHPGFQFSERENILQFMCYDRENRLLIFSNFWQGLFGFDLEGRLKFHYTTSSSSSRISSNLIGFVLTQPGNWLWVGAQKGLNLINTRSNTVDVFQQLLPEKDEMENLFLSCGLIDQNGHAWIGTNDGLFRMTPRKTELIIDGSGLQPSVNDEWTVLTRGPGSHILAGNISRGTWLIDRESGTTRNLEKGKVNMVWSLYHDNDHILIAGNGPGIYEYNLATNRLSPRTALAAFFGRGDIATLYFRDSRGDEWFSINQGGGLVHKPAGTDQYEQYGRMKDPPTFSQGYFANAVEDREGNCWFSVNKSISLLTWEAKEKKFREISLDTVKGLQQAMLGGIQAICPGADSILWVSSESVGLVAYQPAANRARIYTINDGLPTTYIYAMASDNRGRIWLGTLKGLVCFIPEEKRFITFRKDNGLPAEKFTSGALYFDKSANRLWAASGNLIFSVDPEKLLERSPGNVPVMIDEVLVNGSPLPEGNGHRLSFSDNNLRFTFTGIDLNQGNELEYAYFLEGADKDWVYSGDRKVVFYHQLQPGTYHFRVRVRHKGDKEWTVMQTSYDFSIAKAWWQTLGFRLFVLLISAGLLLVVTRIYLNNKLRRHRSALEQELAIEQERIRLARELHDGLGSKLSGVKHSFTALKNELQLNAEKTESFDYTIDKLNESISELRNVSHTMLSAGFLEEGLETALQNYCMALTHGGRPEIHFHSLTDKPLNLHPETAFHIFRVVQELLQNILRHAEAKNALVQLSTHEGWLHITVEDDGKGFDWRPGTRYAGIGLRNIEGRVKGLKGRLDIQTAAGKGTSVHLEIPLTDQVQA